jgi:hypothetical protein
MPTSSIVRYGARLAVERLRGAGDANGFLGHKLPFVSVSYPGSFYRWGLQMITGGCLCGAVRYQTDGQPLVGLRCYCRDCQRASGSTDLPVMIVDKKQFKVTGKTGIGAVTGGSGRKAIRHFCPDCGSLLFGTPEVAPEIVTVYVGSLDDPSVFNPAFAQFTRDRPAWDQRRDLLEFETTPPPRRPAS